MLKVDERTAIVGIAELRTIIPKLLNELKTHKVVLTKRNKPVGVVMDYEDYQRTERFIEALEDKILGHIALRRKKTSKRQDYILLEELERLAGLR